MLISGVLIPVPVLLVVGAEILLRRRRGCAAIAQATIAGARAAHTVRRVGTLRTLQLHSLVCDRAVPAVGVDARRAADDQAAPIDVVGQGLHDEELFGNKPITPQLLITSDVVSASGW